MGITVIVITHEMAVIQAICDRVAIIDHSHIAEGWKCVRYLFRPQVRDRPPADSGDVAEQNLNFGNSQIRIIFLTGESSEPVIANMVLACKVPGEYHACGHQGY